MIANAARGPICKWEKFPSKDLGGYDVYRGQTKGGMTAEQCQRRCDSIKACKAIMHGNSMNNNRWYRKLCWIKTYKPYAAYDKILKYNRGVDVYVRSKSYDCRDNYKSTVSVKYTPKHVVPMYPGTF